MVLSMVIQRISDLVWMGQGICRVGQAQMKYACSRCEHVLNNSSVAQMFTSKLCKKEDCMPEELDVKFEDVDLDKLTKEAEAMSSNTKMSESATGTVEQKREYSTSCRQCYVLRSPRGVLIPSSMHKTSLFWKHSLHTSSLNYAITADDLAKVAKLTKARRSQQEIPNEKKNTQKFNTAQKLSERSKETRVPSSRIGRVASFGGLAAGLMLGTVSEMAKNTFSGDNSQTDSSSSVTGFTTATAFMSDANLERIVNTLCRVRGAALKLGQMLSIQDDSILDPRLLEVFDRVRQSADFMPASQMKKVLVQELGKDWHDKLAEFEDKPFAAASIGQVHRAVLHDGTEVAMKIQYPGVADSINSDISNLVTLLKLWNLFPEKFFIDKFIAVARQELALECDYEREASYFKKFRDILKDDDRYQVPEVISELSTKRVLTTKLISGMPLDKVQELDQDTRNHVASAMLNLLMREIFEFRMMQTDPNWSNFFYDPESRKINLLDFGASQEYPQSFVDDYIEVVHAASMGDRDTVLQKSRALKFLTGYETKVMEDAHVDAVMILGEPFARDEEFDFGTQNTTKRIARLVPTMLEHRLTAPPEESYSLHRKLSGGFLLAAKLKSKFICKPILEDLYKAYHAKKSAT